MRDLVMSKDTQDVHCAHWHTLTCAGGLMSLLFEDLFKRLNTDLKRQADQTLSKANRASQVCVSLSLS